MTKIIERDLFKYELYQYNQLLAFFKFNLNYS
jgi:hypothetical protein